jgi:myo-inositol-1(or 4)-monophosphatase
MRNNVMTALWRAARVASDTLLKLQSGARKVDVRHHDFVTQADYESDQLIREILKADLPNVPIYSEDGGGDLGFHGSVIIVDALDGTVNYFHGESLWGVSLAYVEDGVSQIGVTILPKALRRILVCRSEPGACYYHVSKEQELSAARVLADWVKGDNNVLYRILPKLHAATTLPGIRNCAVASLMNVAEGIADAYVFPGPQPEDIAAGALAVEMAGGRVTEMDGTPWSPFSKTLVASNGLIHDELLALLASV